MYLLNAYYKTIKHKRNGFIIVWGNGTVIANGDVTATNYGITFTQPPMVIAAPARKREDGTPQGVIGIRSINITNFYWQVAWSTQYVSDSYLQWIAMGY